MCGGPSKGLECLADALQGLYGNLRHRLGPGNTNVHQLGSTPPLVPTYRTNPGYHRTGHMSRLDRSGYLGTCTYDRFRRPVGDPRGRKRTGTYWILDTGYWILYSGILGLVLGAWDWFLEPGTGAVSLVLVR